MTAKPPIHVTLTVAIFALAAAACSGSGPSPSPKATDLPAGAPPTAVPGDPGPGGGQGGGTGGSGGGGAGGGGGGVVDPGGGLGPGGANVVVPQPGTQNPQPVQLSGLSVSVDGQRVTATVSWWSGVEPCYVLDSVVVTRDGDTITVTALEGSTGEPVACIEIAQLKATVVDLGELEPGTYVIDVEPGVAPPVTIEIT